MMSLDEKIALFADRFQGNETCISEEWDQKKFAPVCAHKFKTDKGCLIGIKEAPCSNCDAKKLAAPSMQYFIHHITGNKVNKKTGHIIAYGIYVLRGDGKILLSAIDFDEVNFEDILIVKEQFDSLGIANGIARSSSRGHHLYVFFEEWVESVTVLRLFRGILNHQGFDPKTEVFPKQTTLTNKRQSGNLIKPPMIEHKILTGHNCWVDDHNVPIGNGEDDMLDQQWDYFKNIPKVSTADLIEAANDYPEYRGNINHERPNSPEGPYKAPMRGSFEQVINGCQAIAKVLRDPFGKGENKDWITHPMRLGMLTVALRTKDGVSELRKIMPAKEGDWKGPEAVDNNGEFKGSRKFEENVAYAWENQYAPHTCEKFQQCGACPLNESNQCFKPKQPMERINGKLVAIDMPESQWPKPSPIRWAREEKKKDKRTGASNSTHEMVHLLDSNKWDEVNKLFKSNAGDADSSRAFFKLLVEWLSHKPKSCLQMAWDTLKGTLVEKGIAKSRQYLGQCVQEMRSDRDRGFSKSTSELALKDLIKKYFEGNVKDLDDCDICEKIKSDIESDNGVFINIHNAPHIFINGKLLSISNNPMFNGLVQERYRLNYGRSAHRVVWEGLRALCANKGADRSDMAPTFADRKQSRVALSVGDGLIAIVDPQMVSIEQNGSNKGDLFLREHRKMKPVTVTKPKELSVTLHRLFELVAGKLACSNADRWYAFTWMLMHPLVALCSDRSLLSLTGNAGSGKSTVQKIMTTFLMGVETQMNSTQAALFSEATSAPTIAIDNLERTSRKRVEPFLLYAATGASNEKRKLNSDSDTITETVRSMISVSSIEPFDSPELITRSFGIHFEAEKQDPSFLYEELRDDLLDERDELFSAMLWLIADYILPILNDEKLGQRAFHHWIRTSYPKHTKSRFDSFLSLQLLVLHAYLVATKQCSKQDTSQTLSIAAQWITTQNAVAKTLSNESNKIAKLLGQLVSEVAFALETDESKTSADDDIEFFRVQQKYSIKLAYTRSTKPEQVPSIKFETTTAQLLTLFQKLSKNCSTKCSYESPSELGSRLKNDIQCLQEGGWSVELSAKKVSGLNIHKFSLPLPYLITEKVNKKHIPVQEPVGKVLSLFSQHPNEHPTVP